MVVTQPMSSLSPKLLRPPVGQRTKRLSASPVTSPDSEHSSEYHIFGHFSMLLWNCWPYRHTPSSTLSPGSVVQTGPVMGIVFAAFVMGVSLMGGLWCIYNYTGNEISFPPSLNSYGATIHYHPIDGTDLWHVKWTNMNLFSTLIFHQLSANLMTFSSASILSFMLQ